MVDFSSSFASTLEKTTFLLKSFPFVEHEMQFNKEQMLKQPRRYHYKVMEVLLKWDIFLWSFCRQYGWFWGDWWSLWVYFFLKIFSWLFLKIFQLTFFEKVSVDFFWKFFSCLFWKSFINFLYKFQETQNSDKFQHHKIQISS